MPATLRSAQASAMLPLSDGIPARRFPIVNVSLIVACFAVWFPIRIPAYVFLGFWFLYQLVEANFGLFAAKANGGGVAFFAHVGGFIFGLIVTGILTNVGRVAPQDSSGILRANA